MAEATIWVLTDADVRKHGEQTGLDTLLVYAVNDECSALVPKASVPKANALNTPPEEYDRKIKTQRN